MLRPTAETTDRSAMVPPGHLQALAEARLYGLAGPPDAGGAAAGPAVARAVYETLAGACGVTFFVWVQHHAPVRMLAASANAALRRRWLGPLCRGDVLGGVAFAHVRRTGPPAVAAGPVAGGWTIDGEAPWVTSWGQAGFYAVAARADDHVVTFGLDAGAAGSSVRASAPVALAVMGASSTVRLAFEGLFVPDSDVISTLPWAEWRRRDRVATSRPHPAALGTAATATRLLARARPSDGTVGRVAAALAEELARCRRLSYRLADEGRTDPAHLDDLVAARAWGLDVAARSSLALVAATGGAAVALDHPAQRLVREAAFWSIQAQTPPVRHATLTRLRGPADPAGLRGR